MPGTIFNIFAPGGLLNAAFNMLFGRVDENDETELQNARIIADNLKRNPNQLFIQKGHADPTSLNMTANIDRTDFNSPNHAIINTNDILKDGKETPSIQSLLRPIFANQTVIVLGVENKNSQHLTFHSYHAQVSDYKIAETHHVEVIVADVKNETDAMAQESVMQIALLMVNHGLSSVVNDNKDFETRFGHSELVRSTPSKVFDKAPNMKSDDIFKDIACFLFNINCYNRVMDLTKYGIICGLTIFLLNNDKTPILEPNNFDAAEFILFRFEFANEYGTVDVYINKKGVCVDPTPTISYRVDLSKIAKAKKTNQNKKIIKSRSKVKETIKIKNVKRKQKVKGVRVREIKKKVVVKKRKGGKGEKVGGVKGVRGPRVNYMTVSKFIVASNLEKNTYIKHYCDETTVCGNPNNLKNAVLTILFKLLGDMFHTIFAIPHSFVITSDNNVKTRLIEAQENVLARVGDQYILYISKSNLTRGGSGKTKQLGGCAENLSYKYLSAVYNSNINNYLELLKQYLFSIERDVSKITESELEKIKGFVFILSLFLKSDYLNKIIETDCCKLSSDEQRKYLSHLLPTRLVTSWNPEDMFVNKKTSKIFRGFHEDCWTNKLFPNLDDTKFNEIFPQKSNNVDLNKMREFISKQNSEIGMNWNEFVSLLKNMSSVCEIIQKLSPRNDQKTIVSIEDKKHEQNFKELCYFKTQIGSLYDNYKIKFANDDDEYYKEEFEELIAEIKDLCNQITVNPSLYLKDENDTRTILIENVLTLIEIATDLDFLKDYDITCAILYILFDFDKDLTIAVYYNIIDITYLHGLILTDSNFLEIIVDEIIEKKNKQFSYSELFLLYKNYKETTTKIEAEVEDEIEAEELEEEEEAEEEADSNKSFYVINETILENNKPMREVIVLNNNETIMQQLKKKYLGKSFYYMNDEYEKKNFNDTMSIGDFKYDNIVVINPPTQSIKTTRLLTSGLNNEEYAKMINQNQNETINYGRNFRPVISAGGKRKTRRNKPKKTRKRFQKRSKKFQKKSRKA